MGLEAIKKRPVVPDSEELESVKVKVLPVLMEESAHTRKTETVVPKTDTTTIDIDKSPIPELNETESDEDENRIPIPPDSAVSLGTRRTLRRLGELYGEEGSMPSPVRDHTIGEKTPDPTPQHLTSDKSGGRRGRLHALANTINGWEDDLSHYCSPTSRFNLSPPRQPRKSTLGLGGSRSSPTALNFVTPPTAFGPRVRPTALFAATDTNSNNTGTGVRHEVGLASNSMSSKPVVVELESAIPACLDSFHANHTSLNDDAYNYNNNGESSEFGTRKNETASTWDESILIALVRC